MTADSFRILVDECVRLPVLRALQECGYDATRVTRVGGADSPSDLAIITCAAEMGRIVLTDDPSTMPACLQTFVEAGNHHPGMIVGPQSRGLGQYLRDLRYTLETINPEDLRDTFIWLLNASAPAGGV